MAAALLNSSSAGWFRLNLSSPPSDGMIFTLVTRCLITAERCWPLRTVLF